MVNQFEEVVFASDCNPCPDCGEPFCGNCNKHYSDCTCIGPTEECVEYKHFKGVLYGRRRDDFC